jgi:ppGpp synthetase/RelA/SpoT-type nucleotidyltranferase
VTTLEDARLRWLNERARYEAYGKAVAAKMATGVRALGLWCDTSSRAKEPHSLVKKLLKGKHTYDSLSDKVGVRCIIRYRDDLERVVEATQSLFVCGIVDRKADSLGVSQIGYLSIHVDVSLRDDDPLVAHYQGLHAELQIRTLAQHLWSEMSHDAVYKNDVAFAKLSDDLTRRVNLMAGLIEVADQEFNRLNGEVEQRPEVRIYKALESHFFKLTAAHAPDPELSLEVISLLLPLYGEESLASIAARLDAYIADHEAALQQIYAHQQTYTTSELVFQPEALMIAELLDRDEHLALQRLWNERFPEVELERLAVAMGHSFD